MRGFLREKDLQGRDIRAYNIKKSPFKIETARKAYETTKQNIDS